MSKPEVYNFEISDENFDQVVLMNSHKIPVFVLFMSPVSAACIGMENALIDYANKFAGQFILARLDIDMYTEVRDRLEIKNVPMLKIYKDGEMVHQELGAITEEELAATFKKFDIFDPAEDLRLQALEKHANGETPEAIQMLTQAIQMSPGNVNVAMDMCQIFLDMNMLAEGAGLYTKFPNKIKETDTGKYLIGQITFKKLALDTDGIAATEAKLTEQPDNEDAQFDLAVCLFANQQYREGMDIIFSMLGKNPNAKGGGAQELAVVVINLLDLKQKELAGEFRRQLSNTLSN